VRGLKDRTGLLTGGANGIGAAIARRLGEEGCTVGILDLDAAGAEKVVGEIRAAGGKASVHAVDISDYDAVKRAVDAFEAASGPIAFLVNNAGWDRAANFLDTNPEFWAKIVAINLYGPLNVSHIVLKGMAARGFGRVVNIASDAGRVGSSGESVYSACKGGLIAFSKTLAREHARDNIRINVVCPGPTDTALLRSFVGDGEYGQKIYDGLKKAIPLKRLGQPDDIAGMIAFLASDDADFMTGQVISISGGLTMHG
jgi:2-hydroxycyclohexanecarboxyl-CoA dehydrogenase